MDNPFLVTQEQVKKIKEQIILNETGTDRAVMGAKMINVFKNTADGPEVLAFLLKQMKYGSKITGQHEVVLYNLAVGILDLMKEAKENDAEAHMEYSLTQGE